MFFWLPFFLNSHFDSVTANLIAALYSVGMMPGGIVVGRASDMLGGKRATVIAVFMGFLLPCLLGEPERVTKGKAVVKPD